MKHFIIVIQVLKLQMNSILQLAVPISLVYASFSFNISMGTIHLLQHCFFLFFFFFSFLDKKVQISHSETKVRFVQIHYFLKSSISISHSIFLFHSFQTNKVLLFTSIKSLVLRFSILIFGELFLY